MALLGNPLRDMRITQPLKSCCIMVSMRFLSFIYPERGGFGEIFPEVMIFCEGFSPREISSLKEIFRRISRAEGLNF